MRTMTTLATLVGALVLGGCAVETVEDEGEATSELVSQSTFEKARGIVQRIDYLPFDYKDDGCYARSLYMGLELAANGIESNAIFAIAKDDAHELHVPNSTRTWGYHTTPMLMVGGTKAKPVVRVLDPSISANPLTHIEWVKRMGYSQYDANRPALRSIPSSIFATKPVLDALETTDVWTDVPSFAAMPKFQVALVQTACAKMYDYLQLENNSPAETARKRSVLLERTKTLLRAVEAEGKLGGKAAQFSPSRCAQ